MKLNINLVKMEIIYLVVSFLAVIFISTNYLISLIYLLVSSGLFYFVYNLKSKIIFKMDFYRSDLLFKKNYFESLESTKSNKIAYETSLKFLNNKKLPEDFISLKDNVNALNYLKEDEFLNGLKKTILDNNFNISMSLNEINKKIKHLNGKNFKFIENAFLESTLYQFLFLILRFSFSKNVFDFSSLDFTLIYFIISLSPLIFLLLILRKD